MIQAANDERQRGVYPPYQAFYVQSMLFCTRSALRSVATLSRLLGRLEDRTTDRDIRSERLILDSLQNIVSQGAALSRYFWPSRDADPHGGRAQELRQAFEMDDANPLRNRELRNAIEHFDERLDRYLTGQLVGHIVPEYVGHTPDPGGVPLHLFRAYYADAGVFELLGRRYEIEPLILEIDRIHRRLADCDQKGGCFPSENGHYEAS